MSLPAEERLQAFLRARSGPSAAAGPQALSGDASTRRYFRVPWDEGRTAAVAAVYPEPFDPGSHPFLEVHSLLAGWGIPVPCLLAVDGTSGVMVLEDLGDVTLQERLRRVEAGERDRLYGAAIDGLRRMQAAAAGERSADGSTAGCFGLAFDHDKLVWELEFFLTHFVVGHRGARLGDQDRAELVRSCGRLCSEIASWPRVLCHRDYHSRNLMWHGERLVWIDYQDARMGPVTYDLASLLCDAYVEVPDSLVEAQLDRFRRDVAADESPAEFGRRFDLTVVQRTLKALGTFGYQATVRGNTAYLEYVPRTLNLARRRLARHAELHEIQGLLARHIEELRA